MKWLFGLLVIAALLLAGYTELMLRWSYSTGERAGYVQKLSKKGWICKTWEGEVASPRCRARSPSASRSRCATTRSPGRSTRTSVAESRSLRAASGCDHALGETQYFVTR
jgi:hypothetical protein